MENRYESMLPRLAELARRHPRLYRARVVALAALGYGLVLGLLFVLAAVLVVVVALGLWEGMPLTTLKVAVPLLLFLGLVVEALWVEIVPPRRMVLSRAEAPALWAEIERVRRAMGAPAPYQVMIDGELNASVQQVPRLGLLGLYRTYLTIGLPLAAMLTADELRAVLAHEFGHVSRRHGRLGVWIHRARATWEQMLESLEESRHWTRGLFRLFLRWYVPFLDAYTAVLRRAHEFDADRAAVRVAGAGAAAAGLCRVRVAGRYLESVFWPSVFADAAAYPGAPVDVFRRLLREGPDAARHADAPRWLAEEARRTTAPWDSHPALADRLAALGAAPALSPEPAQPSAAQVFLGAKAERLADLLGRRWANMTQVAWGTKHREHLRMTERLAAIEARAGRQPLPAEQARERIVLTVKLHGQTVAMPLMRELLDADENDSTVHLLMGRTLLDQDDEAGLRHLERAMELDVDATPAACAAAAEFLAVRGRAGDAAAFRLRCEEYLGTVQSARAERAPGALDPGDRFLPHGLDEALAGEIAARLAMQPWLKRALLVRKEMAFRPEARCFVLAVEPVSWEQGPNLAQSMLRLARFPGSLIVVDMTTSGPMLNGAIARVAGAEIYRRDAPARAAR